MKNLLQEMKLALITGGWTGERRESISISRNVEKILQENNVTPKFIILDESPNILPQLENLDVDFALIMMSEEVPLQPILDALGISYNGSSNLATSLSLNKKFVKTILETNGVTVAKDFVCKRGDKNFSIPFNFPYVVKPLRCGSSCGVSLVRNNKELQKACDDAFKYDSKILIEEYIDGQEITIPVIGNFIMNPVKITSSAGIWDEERKNNLEVEFTAVKPEEEQTMKSITETINIIRDTFELESFWRVDAVFKDNKLYVLEINTQPCLAGGKKGVLPTSEKAMGWTHFEFLTNVVEEAYKRKKSNFKNTFKLVS